MAEYGHYVYRLSSHDPLRGPSAQETIWFLGTSPEACERWLRALYRDFGAGVQPSAPRSIVDGQLWAFTAEQGKTWFIAREPVHLATCNWLDRPVPLLADKKVTRCSCMPDGEDQRWPGLASE